MPLVRSTALLANFGDTRREDSRHRRSRLYRQSCFALARARRTRRLVLRQSVARPSAGGTPGPLDRRRRGRSHPRPSGALRAQYRSRDALRGVRAGRGVGGSAGAVLSEHLPRGVRAILRCWWPTPRVAARRSIGSRAIRNGGDDARRDRCSRAAVILLFSTHRSALRSIRDFFLDGQRRAPHNARARLAAGVLWCRKLVVWFPAAGTDFVSLVENRPGGPS
jgi:hypothetical protein